MGLQVRDTTDPDEIRQWIQLHHGAPARVPDTASVRTADALLVDFVGARSGDYLDHISWADWFAWFDDHGLCFRYPQDPDSLTFQLIPRAASQPGTHVVNRNP
ncbi:hypothetical protein P3H15_48980 [Rhodococcus sp. T2V]|uniref:hypothetical protein n=1 Tax=Rhodococcus sp. T2V TaxID=3034164 RepID=UPI0023E0D34E|nr:hypothetical protein [Rhodococcus sp. T2V]MDF3312870.1 hypothetical protein [Rhodococcus sp. T2V]